MEYNANRIYLSGAISGLPHDACVAKFETAEKIMQQYGYEVANPIKIALYQEGKTWHEYMGECLAVLPLCGSILMLPCWHQSRGAQVEHATALALGIPIQYMCSIQKQQQ
jgi:hypothetical protein